MSLRNKVPAAAAILLVISLGIWFGLSRDPAAPSITPDETGQGTSTPFDSSDAELAQLNLERESDRAEVFRRAFWRNPGSGDTVRQAERREWSDASGVQRWDWFIAVEASEALAAYLLEQNPFQLMTKSEPQTFTEVPAWFPESSEGFNLHQSQSGEMTVLFNPDTRQLYATGQGFGFRSGAPEPQPSTIPQQNQSRGRLPDAPPPRPE